MSSLALEDMIGTDDLLSKFDVDDIATEALLFQTGYLTISRREEPGRQDAVSAGLSEPGGEAESE